MKEITTEEQIGRLEDKVSELNLKIKALKQGQKQEDRNKAFDLIMELGDRYDLFDIFDEDVKHVCGHVRTTVDITMSRQDKYK